MKPTAVIFDINGVLFKENKLKLLKKIGLKRILQYLARHRTNPIATCLNTLQAIYDREQHTDTTPPIIFKNRSMPQCTADWQRGYISSDAVLSTIQEQLASLSAEGYFNSPQELRLIERILHTTMDSRYLMSISRPMKRTIRLVEKLKKKQSCKLFILSNMGHEPFALLKKTYPEVIALFDDVIISADTTFIKPEPMIFRHLLEKHNLSPQECVFIDDQQENIIAAQGLGIYGLLFTKASLIRKQLKAIHLL